MSAIVGYAGAGDARLLGKMLGRLRPRGEVATATHVERALGLGLAWAPTPYERAGAAAVAASEDGAVRAVFDGYLINAEELRRTLDERGLDVRRASHAALAANVFAVFGERGLERLDGSFAVAFARDGRLWVVRDALGEKPVYFTTLGKRVLFASEIKAFLDVPGFRPRPNLEALTRVLVFSFVPGERTMFAGVRELLPGHVLRVERGAATTRPYWDLVERVEDRPEPELRRRLGAAVTEAVESRLPERARVGAFLSGGVDSSAVVAVLARLGVRMTAFSVAFGDRLPNELRYAKMVAEHCGVRHRIMHVHPEGFVDLLPKVIYSLDDPLCDCITVPNFLLGRAAAEAGCDVVFNGEGGDPLFGGPKNKFLILREWYDFVGESDRTTAYLSSYHKLYDHLAEVCTPELLEAGGGVAALQELMRPYLHGDRQRSFLNRLMYVNVKLKGGQNILVKVDKVLSANGIAVASPLFDRRLAELSFELPPRLKRRGDVEKYLFKRAVEKLLPRPVVYRKKEGMGVPLNQWFRDTALRGYATEMLLSKRARERGLFRQAFVEALLGGDGAHGLVGQDRSGEYLWMLMAIELWFRVFADGDGA